MPRLLKRNIPGKSSNPPLAELDEGDGVGEGVGVGDGGRVGEGNGAEEGDEANAETVTMSDSQSSDQPPHMARNFAGLDPVAVHW